jgi:hypothetical protein
METRFKKHLAAATCQFVLLLGFLPAVAGVAREHRTRGQPVELTGQDVDGFHFHVHELAPGLRMRMEPLHEPRVAVHASVGAAGVAVERVVADRRLIEEALALDFTNDNVSGGELFPSRPALLVEEIGLLVYPGHGDGLYPCNTELCPAIAFPATRRYPRSTMTLAPWRLSEGAHRGRRDRHPEKAA